MLGSWDTTGGTVYTTSTVTFATTTASTQNITSNGSAFHAFTINDAGGGATVSLQDKLNASSTITITGGTLTTNTYDIYIDGNFTNSDTFTHGSAGMNFTSSTDQTLTSGGSSLYDLTHSGNATLTITDTTTVTNNISNSLGTLEIDGLTTLTGDLTNLATITEDASYIIKSNSAFSFDQNSYDGNSDTLLTLTITDKDENLDGTTAETQNFTISVSGLPAVESEVITLTETGVASGVFTGTIPITALAPGSGDGDLDLTVNSSGNITTAYTDSEDATDTGSISSAFNSEPSSGGGGGGGGGIGLFGSTLLEDAGILINNGASYTNTSTVSLSLFAKDAVVMGISENPDLSGASFQPYKTNLVWDFGAEDGEHTIYVKYRDAKNGGRESAIVRDTIIVDTIAPVKPIIEIPKDKEQRQERELIVTGTGEPGASVQLQLDRGALIHIQVGNDGKWSYLYPALLTGGEHTITVYSTDAAGNESEPRSIKFSLVSILVLPGPPDRIPLPPLFPGIPTPTTTPTSTTPIIPITTTTPTTTKPLVILPPLPKLPDISLDPLKLFTGILGENARDIASIIVKPIADIIEQPPAPDFTPVGSIARILEKTVRDTITATKDVTKQSFLVLSNTFKKLPTLDLKPAILFAEILKDSAHDGISLVISPVTNLLKAPPLPNIRPARMLADAVASLEPVSRIGNTIGQAYSKTTDRIAMVFLNQLETKDEIIEATTVKIVDSSKPVPSRIPLLSAKEIAMITPFGDLNLSPQTGEKASLPPGERVKLYVKPEREVNQITATMLFTTSLSIEPHEIKYIFVKPVQAAATAQAKEYIVDETSYADINGDGVWEATIVLPVVGGDYAIETAIDYVNGIDEIFKREFLIDPEGYVFRKAGDDEARLSDTAVTIYRLNERVDNGYVIWNAGVYDQINPQITDKTGEYSFLVPAGTYYITAFKEGFKPFETDPFVITRSSPVHLNIELKKTSIFDIFR